MVEDRGVSKKEPVNSDKKAEFYEITIGTPISDIDPVLYEKTQKLIELGEYSKAKELREKMRSKREMDFEEFHKQLPRSKTIDPSSKEAYDFSQQNVSSINKLLIELNKLINHKSLISSSDLAHAENLYKKIKEAYLNLPDSYDEERFGLQKKILDSYKIIIKSKKETSSSDNIEKIGKISFLLKDTVDFLDKGDKEKAVKSYDQLRIAYSNLPEKSVLQNAKAQSKMQDIYQKLYEEGRNAFLRDFEKKERQIMSLIDSAKNNSKKNNISLAQRQFHDVSEFYIKLPAGFIEQKAHIQFEVLDLYRMISLKIHKDLINGVKHNHLKINSLIGIIKKCLANNSIPLAKSSYKKLILLYHKIPYAYLHDNKLLREEVTQIHKMMLLHELGYLHAFDKETRSDFDKIVDKLSKVNSMIKERDFKSLEKEYNEVCRLFERIPSSALKERTRLYDRIYSLYEELLLYNEIKKLEISALKNDEISFKDELFKIEDSRKKLQDKYPDDIELFSYIKDMLRIYYNMKKGEDSRENFQKKILVVSRQKDLDAMESTIAIGDHEKSEDYLKLAYS